MISKDQAETLGLEAVTWLLTHDDLLPIFMGSTGADASSFQERPLPTELLISVLDFILMDDEWVREFCDHQGRDYQWPYAAREILGAGDKPNWT